MTEKPANPFYRPGEPAGAPVGWCIVGFLIPVLAIVFLLRGRGSYAGAVLLAGLLGVIVWVALFA